MSASETIDRMLNRILPGENIIISSRIQLYSTGVKAKLRNAEFALTNLENLYHQENNSIFIPDFTTLESIHFYIDSFFAFLYSAFDVIAQVINQKLRIGIDENKVSIKKIKGELEQYHNGTIIQQNISDLIVTNFFKNLERYRNCSTHRRQIYIESKTTTKSGTPAYSVSGPLIEINRLLCDNPLTLTPTMRQKRELLHTCSAMLKRANSEISNIAKKL